MGENFQLSNYKISFKSFSTIRAYKGYDYMTVGYKGTVNYVSLSLLINGVTICNSRLLVIVEQ